MALAVSKNNYGTFSKLRFTHIIVDEDMNVTRLGLRDRGFKRQLIVKVDRYTKYKIKSEFEFRPDLISQQFYGTPDLWWVIFEYNDFKHTFKDFYTDRQIMIPDRSLVTVLFL